MATYDIAGGSSNLTDVSSVADADYTVCKQSAAAQPRRATFTQIWTWIVAKITANPSTVRTAAGLGGAAVLSVGTTAGTVAAGDDSRFAAAAQKASNLSDLAGPLSTVQTNLGLAIGTNVQAYDAELAALAGLTSAADKLPYFTGSGAAAVTSFTAAGRALVDDADATAQRATLGVLDQRPDFVASRWYPPAPYNIALATVGGIGSIRLMPFWLGKSVTISDLATRVGTIDAAPGHFQLAIYAANATTGLPTGTAVANTGDMLGSSLGVISAAISGGNKSLTGGSLYWMASNSDSATLALVSYAAATMATNFLMGTTTLANLTTGNTAGMKAYSYATSYNTWPDLTGVILVEVTSASAPVVFFKAA